MQIRLNMQTRLGLSETDTEYTYTYDITEEITASRHIMRDSKYFQQQSLTTLSNKPLDCNILQFAEPAQQNKDLHYTHVATHKLSSRIKHTPIFIFEEHRQKHTKISNKTIAEICSYRQTQLEHMKSETLNKKWKKLKTAKKAVLLKFLKELNEMQLAENQSESDMD